MAKNSFHESVSKREERGKHHTARTEGRQVIFGFDRITMFIDRSELPVLIERLIPHCTDVKVYPKQVRYQARWKCAIKLFQPTRKCLEIFRDGLGTEVSAKITYAEIACDVLAVDANESNAWMHDFLILASMKYLRQLGACFQGTWYFGRRPSERGGKYSGHVLAAYADRPSKLNNRKGRAILSKCLHVEWRAYGAIALERFGIVSIDDLIAFDFMEFWNENVYLYQLPKPTVLGEILAEYFGVDLNVSGTALRKRAMCWKNKYSDNGVFLMHNAIVGTRGIQRYMDKVPFMDWIGNLASG